MTRYQRPASNQQDYAAEEDPDNWITKYEQEMSTLKPRDALPVPNNDATAPDVELTPGSLSKSKIFFLTFVL